MEKRHIQAVKIAPAVPKGLFVLDHGKRPICVFVFNVDKFLFFSTEFIPTYSRVTSHGNLLIGVQHNLALHVRFRDRARNTYAAKISLNWKYT